MTKDTPKGDRIAKVLARAGIASRRGAESIIAAGRVAVNGKQIDSPALNVTPADQITVDGKPLAEPEPERMWLYHKPTGVVTSDADEKGRQTIYDTLPDDMPRVMSIGRLDINSEGLLLLTNDGGIKRKLELPAPAGCANTGCGSTGGPRTPHSIPCAADSPSRASGSSPCTSRSTASKGPTPG